MPAESLYSSFQSGRSHRRLCGEVGAQTRTSATIRILWVLTDARHCGFESQP